MNFGIQETKVNIESIVKLAGTLSIPKTIGSELTHKYPAILILAGSGPSDRDGNGGGMDMNIYKNLSDFLVSIGFATLRYDKRGTHASEGDFKSAGLWDLVDDAEDCLRYLQSHPALDPEKVFVLGHSEGAIIAPILETRIPVAGLILLAGFADTGKVMLTSQAEQIFNELEATEGMKGFFMRLFRVIPMARKRNAKALHKILESTEPSIKIGPSKVNAKWYREHYAFSVLDYFSQVKCPVLAITGDRDVQVDPEHVHIITKLVQGPAEGHIVPKMNHILCHYEGTHTMYKLMKEYQKLIGSPLHPELKFLLESWLHKQLILN